MLRSLRPLLAAALLVPACAPAPVAEPACTATADCASGLVCVEARCVPRPLDAGLDAGCASGACECTASAECTAPAPCIEAVCVLGVCEERAYDARCASGEYCDRALGCRPLPDAGSFDAPPPDAPRADAPIVLRDAGLRPVGAPCILDRECAPVAGLRPQCIDALGELAPGVPAPPDGYCSAECMPLVPGGCGPDAVCVETNIVSGGAWCLGTCTSAAECRPGQSCAIPMFGGLGSVRVCLPPL